MQVAGEEGRLDDLVETRRRTQHIKFYYYLLFIVIILLLSSVSLLLFCVFSYDLLGHIFCYVR